MLFESSIFYNKFRFLGDFCNTRSFYQSGYLSVIVLHYIKSIAANINKTRFNPYPFMDTKELVSINTINQ